MRTLRLFVTKQRHPDHRHLAEERATKLALTGVFFATVGAFAAPPLRRSAATRIGPFDLLLLGMTTYRVGNIVSYERIADPIREPFAERVSTPDGEEEIEPKGVGAQRALGELFTCPICVGRWAAAGLVYGLHLVPQPTRAFMAIMSATAVAQLTREAAQALRAGTSR